MRSANIITIAGTTLAAAGIANAGIVNAGPASRDASSHINAILTFPARQAGLRGSAAVFDPANAPSCADSDSCDETPSVVQAKSAPVESATHCICYPSAANDIAARTLNETSAAPPEVTGGAIPQQMQASMAGLLGFFIMCLVML